MRAGGWVQDLTLARLRQAWADTPATAGEAVQEWQRVWHGEPPSVTPSPSINERPDEGAKELATGVRVAGDRYGDLDVFAVEQTAGAPRSYEQLRDRAIPDPVPSADDPRRAPRGHDPDEERRGAVPRLPAGKAPPRSTDAPTR